MDKVVLLASLQARVHPSMARQLGKFKAAEGLRRADEMPTQAERVIALGQTVLDGRAKVICQVTNALWLFTASVMLCALGFVTPVKRGR